jgi:hypothetical protein
MTTVLIKGLIKKSFSSLYEARLGETSLKPAVMCQSSAFLSLPYACTGTPIEAVYINS